MIFNISDSQFKDIMQNPALCLPIRWDGRDFEIAISNLLDEYMDGLLSYPFEEQQYDRFSNYIEINIDEIEKTCNLLKQCVREYHQGFPATAFQTINRVMKNLMQAPLKVYQKSGALEPFETDRLYLFRLRSIYDAAKHARKDLFRDHPKNCVNFRIGVE